VTETLRAVIVMGLMTAGAAIGVYWSVPPAMVFAIFPAFVAGLVAGRTP
jgi:K+-transporting ATPase A subunit